MNNWNNSISILVVALAVSAGASQVQGGWELTMAADPASAWTKNGTVVKASNLGPKTGATNVIEPVKVAGITFDTDLSNISGGVPGSGYIPAKPAITDYYYSGGNPAVSNLVNTWLDAFCWWDEDPNKDFSINFSNLAKGHHYQFQILIGFPWEGVGVNLRGPDLKTEYFSAQSGQGKHTGMATLKWTAISSNAQFTVNIPVSEEAELMAYSLTEAAAAPGSSTNVPATSAPAPAR